MNIKVYQSGLKFLLIDAVAKLYNGEVIYEHSLDHGVLATIKADKIVGSDVSPFPFVLLLSPII